MLPGIQVSQKTVFTCDLLLPSSINVEILKRWLAAGNAVDIRFSRIEENTEIYSQVCFQTDDANLVKKLQSRCRDLALAELRQKDEENANLRRELMEMRCNASRFQEVESQYRELESQYNRLLQDYRRIYRDLRDCTTSRSQQPMPEGKRTIAPHIPVDTCIICGRAAMPAQGICLECSR